MIDAGIKLEEYREIKQYYIARFFAPVEIALRDLFESTLQVTDNDINDEAEWFGSYGKEFDAVELIAGYSRTSRRSLYEFKGLSAAYGKPEWGAPTDRKVFAINLGKRLK